ncbi:uncharacterized protein LOC125178829, partial [Hyalella azteca]|uniref:Uncharacterized protein LOC125178829 n=1 Tax=Hyalella azteca TaxID=294128 RepID=A0A979FQT7_HYAAZ
MGGEGSSVELGSPISCIATPDSGFLDWCLVGGVNGSVTLLGLENHALQPVTSTLVHAARQDVAVSGLAWAEVEGSAAVGYSDGAVRICSVHSPSALTIHIHQGAVELLCWSPTGGLLFSGGPRCASARVWRLQEQQRLGDEAAAAPSSPAEMQRAWSPVHNLGLDAAPVTAAAWSGIV